ncbi:MAG: diaminopimelate epimerase [Parachlamydiaceae bacterium]
MTIHHFAKYEACGNDFILFDNRHHNFPLNQALIQRLCHRQIGIGADGLILLENPTTIQAHVRFRIFNCDGHEAEMCGNGIRCLIKWMKNRGFDHDVYFIETMHNTLKGSLTHLGICVEMGTPQHIQYHIPLQFEGSSLNASFIHIGVPHTILFTEDIENIKIKELGHYIRHHSLWSPEGTNLTIAQKTKKNNLTVRTYERGVEGETLACGTGATAAALAAAHHYNMKAPITVQTRLGDELTIGFIFENQKFSEITLTGPAHPIFTGEIELEASIRTI